MNNIGFLNGASILLRQKGVGLKIVFSLPLQMGASYFIFVRAFCGFPPLCFNLASYFLN